MNNKKRSGDKVIDKRARIRAREITTSGFHIPSSGHLRLLLGRKILEIALLFLRFYSRGSSEPGAESGREKAEVIISRTLRRFLLNFCHATTRSRVWLHIVLTLVLLDPTASAQDDTAESSNGEPEIEENRAEPSRTTTETDDAAMSEAAIPDHTDPNRTDLTLSEFLFAIRVGPFFSFGLWAGLLGEIEFEFKLHDRGFLSLLTSVNGGHQIDRERGDYLFSETLGYRHYFPNSSGGAWTFFGGVSFGYFTTTYDQLEERGLDWLQIGLKAKGGYYFLTDESLSVGIDIGFSLSYQLDEYVGSSDFFVAIPDLSVTLLF